MAIRPDHEAFIPVRVADLVDILCHDTGSALDSPLAESDQKAFRRFADAVGEHVHHDYLQRLRRLKADYDAFDPDCDLLALAPEPANAPKKLDDLFDQFARLLQQANYRRLNREELEMITRGASQWGVDMRVEWEAFDKLDVYVRGLTTGTRIVRNWKTVFRKREVQVPVFSRVVVILRQREHKSHGPGADTKNVFLKLFKDIPRNDVEMLLPATRIRFALFDKVRLGGTGLGSLGYVLFKLTSLFAPLLKVGTMITTGAIFADLFGERGLFALLAVYTPLALVGGYAYKTYANYATTRQNYQLQLSKSLYYQNLDNNAGVLYRLLDSAEEQVTREVLLAYYFLWRHAGREGWTEAELDHRIQTELREKLAVAVDFDIHDAVGKLERAGVVKRTGDHLRAVPVDEATTRVDEAWNTPAEPDAKMTSRAAVG
ncbi:MAG: TMEM143 family protein [Fimbriiglobus sp.]|jgi:hypothetical protein|nr:TMEM143 family protein [Fimbriiglobus sp.]